VKELLAHSVQTADHELCKPQSPGHYASERSDVCVCVLIGISLSAHSVGLGLLATYSQVGRLSRRVGGHPAALSLHSPNEPGEWL